jgi:fructokinase
VTSGPQFNPVVIGLGEVLWDLLPAGKQLGGAPANFAWHAQQLGARSAVVSAVGRDPLGDEILARLRAMELDGSHVSVDDTHPTGTVSVTLDLAGVPNYVIHEDVAWDFIPAGGPLDELARRADVVCFGTLAQRSEASRQAVRKFLFETRADCLRVFDINLRQRFYDRHVIEASLARASVLKLNDQELPAIAKLLTLPRDEAGAVRMLFRGLVNLRLVALTRGSSGSTLFARDGVVSHHPGVGTTLVDTVGAGDAFTATLAIGLLRGRPLDHINEVANRVAAYVCSQPGATPPLPAELVASL